MSEPHPMSSDFPLDGPAGRSGPGPLPLMAWLVVLAGLGLRLWTVLHTAAINPDGALYIHQAMAIFHRNWSSLKTCGLSFISAYPVLIAGLYPLTRDWVLSAQLISLIFGTGLLIPLYLLIREWVREDSAILCLTVFAVTPMLVGNSAELVRDPINWFFLTAGTLAVIRSAGTRSGPLLLVASLCFLAAIWARIEAILFPALTLGYLLADSKNRRVSSLLFFISPFLIIALFSIAGVMISGVSFNDLNRANEIAGQIIGPFRRYRELADSLKHLVWSSPDPSMAFFLPEARNTIWLIAFGTVLNRFLEAFFYPFVLFYLIGLSGIRNHRTDNRLWFLALLAASGLVLMYMHTLQAWMLYYRFFGIVIIPGAVFCALGLEKLLDILPGRLSLRPAAIFWGLLLIIFLAALPKNLSTPDPDKQVFAEIGQAVYHHAPDSAGVRIATSCRTQMLVNFYVHLHYPGMPPCPLNPENCWDNYPDDPQQFYERLRQNGQGFVLWEENAWTFHFRLSDPKMGAFYHEIGRWRHPDTGIMILYAVGPAAGGG